MTKNRNKCANIPCLCEIPEGQEYCGDACRDASSQEVEIACQCDHSMCPLMPEFSYGSASLHRKV
jgi:hypothetical protein